MKRLIWFTTAFIIFLVFVVPAILALGIKFIPGESQPGFNLTLSVYGERNIQQKFVVSENNLSAIGTSIKNPNLRNKKDILFNLYNEKMELVRSTKLNGLNIEDGSFVKFIFDPILDSKNKTYIFDLSSPQADSEDMIQVFLAENPPSWIVEYNYDFEKHVGGIPMVVFYKPVNKFEVVRKIYSNLFSRLLFHRSQTI